MPSFPNETSDYREARDALLRDELDLRRRIADVADRRRRLPLGGEIPEDYAFTEWDPARGTETTTRLSELFADGHVSLFVYQFMFRPGASGDPLEVPCPVCTSIIDGIDGIVRHVTQRASLAVIAKAPVARFAALRAVAAGGTCACSRRWGRPSTRTTTRRAAARSSSRWQPSSHAATAGSTTSGAASSGPADPTGAAQAPRRLPVADVGDLRPPAGGSRPRLDAVARLPLRKQRPELRERDVSSACNEGDATAAEVVRELQRRGECSRAGGLDQAPCLVDHQQRRR